MTHAFNDDDLNDAVEAAARRVKAAGLEFRLWNLAGMCRMFEERPVLVSRYFGPARAEAFLGRATTATLADLPGPAFPTGGSMAQQALALKQTWAEFNARETRDELSGEMNASLDGAHAALRESGHLLWRNG